MTKCLALANSSEIALVDARDYDWLKEHKWYLVYPRKHLYKIKKGGMNTTIYLHREIYKRHHETVPNYLGHANKNNLDNRLENIIPTNRGRVKSVLLTPREEEVASLVIQGLGRKEIASKLYVIPETINMHLSNIYRKLGIDNYADMIHILSNNKDNE